MTIARLACLQWLFFSATIQPVSATECITSGVRYHLASDTVEWRMQIRSGETCVRGMRFGNVANIKISLTSAPRFGDVTLLGPAFSYTAKPDFQGEDSFVLGLSGIANRVSGKSTIRILVSIVGPQEEPSVPAFPNCPPRSVSGPSPNAPPPPSVDSTSPSPAGARLPPCPIWDWSRGTPPPMCPPFDTSKLYCPPPPFNPPGQPIGCTCPP
jgi:hypothetical protein